MGELWALRAAIKASVKSNMALCVQTRYLKQGPPRSLVNVVQIQLFSGSKLKTQGVKFPEVTRNVWGLQMSEITKENSVYFAMF